MSPASPSDWFPLFMTGMGVGCLWNLGPRVTPIEETGPGFHRFVSAMVLCFLTIAFAVLPPEAAQPFLISIDDPYRMRLREEMGKPTLALPTLMTALQVVFLLATVHFVACLTRPSWTTKLASFVAWATGAAFLGVYSLGGQLSKYDLVKSLGVLTAFIVNVSGMLVGVTLVGMLVGHAYLRNPSMPFATLQRMARIYAGVLGVRFALYLWALFDFYIPLWKASPLSFEMLLEQHLPFQLLRVLAGFILSAPLAYMILKCADLRSNQSATGILYVAVVFALIGELVGFYYFGQTGVPL